MKRFIISIVCITMLMAHAFALTTIQIDGPVTFSGGGNATPGGINGQLQFNNVSTFQGVANSFVDYETGFIGFNTNYPDAIFHAYSEQTISAYVAPNSLTEDAYGDSGYVTDDEVCYKYYAYRVEGSVYLYSAEAGPECITVVSDGDSIFSNWEMSGGDYDGVRILRQINSGGYTTGQDVSVGTTFTDYGTDWTTDIIVSPSSYNFNTRVQYDDGTNTYGFYTDYDAHIPFIRGDTAFHDSVVVGHSSFLNANDEMETVGTGDGGYFTNLIHGYYNKNNHHLLGGWTDDGSGSYGISFLTGSAVEAGGRIGEQDWLDRNIAGADKRAASLSLDVDGGTGYYTYNYIMAANTGGGFIVPLTVTANGISTTGVTVNSVAGYSGTIGITCGDTVTSGTLTVDGGIITGTTC